MHICIVVSVPLNHVEKRVDLNVALQKLTSIMVCMNWFSIILKSKQHARFNKFKCLRYDSTRVVTISIPQGARMYDYVSRQRGSLALLSAVVIYSDTPLMLLSTWERDDQESGWKRWEVRVRIVFSKNRKFFSLDSQYYLFGCHKLPWIHRQQQFFISGHTTTWTTPLTSSLRQVA